MIKIPEKSRLFFVGDLHGEYNFLIKCLQKLKFRFGKDYLIATGDLIDRGKQSLDTLFMFDNNKRNKFYSVRGNHEQMFLEGHEIGNYINTRYNGGKGWLACCDTNMLDIVAKHIEQLPYYLDFQYKGKTFGIVHAEVHPLFSWKDLKQNIDSGNNYIIQKAIWDIKLAQEFTKDTLVYAKPVHGIDYVIHGHYIIDKPVIAGNRLYIDVGSKDKLCIAEYTGLGYSQDWNLNIFKKEEIDERFG